MRVLQDFNEVDRNALRKYFIAEGHSLEFAYFESIITIFEIAYTLAKKERYIKFIKNKNDLLELDMQQDISENFKKFIDVLKEFNDLVETLKFYTLSLYVQEFMNEVHKEKEFWNEFQANSTIYLKKESCKSLNNQLLRKMYDLQDNLICRYNSKDKNEFNGIFIEQFKASKRNVNKNYLNFINNINNILLTYKEFIVVNFELCYEPRLRKGTFSYAEMKRHRKIFFSKIGKLFTLEFQYYGFAWQLKFNRNERVKFKTILFFNPKIFIQDGIDVLTILSGFWNEITNGYGFIKTNTAYRTGTQKEREIYNLQVLKIGYVHVSDNATVKYLIQIGYEMTAISFHLKPNLVEIKKLYEPMIKEVKASSSLEEPVKQIDGSSPSIEPNSNKKSDGNLFSMKVYLNKKL